VRCAHALLKAGFGALRPYILVLLDIVLGFGISGQPLRAAAKHDTLCSSFQCFYVLIFYKFGFYDYL